MFLKFKNFKKYNFIFCLLLYAVIELLILPGCSYQKKDISINPVIASKEEFLKRIKSINETYIEDLKIFGKGEINSSEGKKKFKIAILLKKPGFHNLQILSPFGNPLATVSGNTTESYLTDFRNNQIILSKPPEKIIFRITGYRGGISNLIDFVSARIPVDFKNADDYQADTDTSGDYYKIIINNLNGNQMEYFIDKVTLMPVKVIISNKYRNSTETISYDGEIVKDGLHFPSDITFTNSQGIETFRLYINEISINSDIPVTKFEFQNPMNFIVKEIEK